MEYMGLLGKGIIIRQCPRAPHGLMAWVPPYPRGPPVWELLKLVGVLLWPQESKFMGVRNRGKISARSELQISRY